MSLTFGRGRASAVVAVLLLLSMGVAGCAKKEEAATDVSDDAANAAAAVDAAADAAAPAAAAVESHEASTSAPPAEDTRPPAPPPPPQLIEQAPSGIDHHAPYPSPVIAPHPGAGSHPGGSAEVAPPKPSPSSEPSLDEILASMKIASIAFNVPQHIDLDKTAEIQLLLSLDQTVSQLQSQLEEAGARTGSQIRVSQSMEAALTGPHFQIEAITPEAQAITQHGATEWKWEVVPKKSGRLNLHLTLTAIVEMEGRSVKHAIRTFDKTIEINVSFNQRATAFIEENWKWLWATILVPLAAWLLRRRRKGEG